MEESAIRQMWARRGFNCGVWTDPPGQVWEGYAHATDELVCLLAGEIEVELQGRKVRPKPGDEVLIPAGVTHTVRNPGKAPNRWCFGYARQQPRG